MFSVIEPSKKSELVSYPIRDIVQEAKKVEAQGVKMTYLNIGDPGPFGFRPPQHILTAVKEALDKNYSGYAPSGGDPELCTAVAKYENVTKGDVFITSGLSEGIDFLFQAMVDPGRNILLPSPSYPLYLTKQRVSFGSEVFYNCDDNWIPDVSTMRGQITPYTKAILVISPNNPTGAVYSRKTLQEIVNLAGEYNLPIISDDAYEMLVFEGEKVNLREICKDVPLVSGGSLSKNFIYPGSRVGWLAFHGDKWEKVKDAVQRLCNQRLSVNWEMQRGGIAALNGSMDFLAVFNSELKKRRDVLVKKVNAFEGLRIPAPKGAFYALVEVTPAYAAKWKSDKELALELIKNGVVIVPGNGFVGPQLRGRLFFRIVFLPTVQQLESALDTIETVLKSRM